MQSRFPSFLMLCVLTLLMLFQHGLVKSAESASLSVDLPASIATLAAQPGAALSLGPGSTDCHYHADPIRLNLGELKALSLSTRKERARWNARPDVMSVQSGPGHSHLLKAEKPGHSELRLGFDPDSSGGEPSCTVWRLEVGVDLSQAQALLSEWVAQEARVSPWSAPRVQLSARGALIVLEGEVAQAEQGKALESLIKLWLEAQSFSGLRLVNWLHIRPAEQIMLEVRIAEVSSRLLDKLGIDWQVGKEQPVSNGLGQWSAQAGFSSRRSRLGTSHSRRIGHWRRRRGLAFPMAIACSTQSHGAKR